MFNNKKVIIFDMDGTLIDSVGVWNLIDQELIQHISHEKIDETTIQQRRDEALRYFSHAEDPYLEYCGFLKENYNVLLSKEEIRNLRYEIATTYMIEVIDFKPDVEKFLHYLKQKDFILVIASTTSNANLQKYMTSNRKMFDKVNFENTFSLILGRDTVQKMKPHPQIHHLIMETLNVTSEECLIIEDSLIGLEAAENAGVEAVIMYDKYSDDDRFELNRRALASFKTYQELLAYTKNELESMRERGNHEL